MGTTAVFLLGVLVGFFGAFNAVFSDVFGVADRVIAASVVFGMYYVVGFLIGLPGYRLGWRWALYLWLPGFVLLGLYSLREPQAVGWHIAVLAVALVAALAGTLSGAALRRKMRSGA